MHVFLEAAIYFSRFEKELLSVVYLYIRKIIFFFTCFLKSVVTLGAAAGGILGGYLVDKVGRKLSLMLCSIPYIFGYIVIISAQNVWMLYFGRTLTGLASGITSLVVPVSKMFFCVCLCVCVHVWWLVCLFGVVWCVCFFFLSIIIGGLGKVTE